jgi:hypothetical protein
MSPVPITYVFQSTSVVVTGAKDSSYGKANDNFGISVAIADNHIVVVTAKIMMWMR